MKNLRNEKGITLVALVVTIIVLLILAGVSLSLVAGGNGIIDKASKASDRTIEASAREQAELRLAELVADYYEAKYVTNTLTATDTNQLAYITSKITANPTVGDYTLSVTGTTLTVKKGETIIGTATLSDEGKMTNWATPTDSNS